MVKESIIMPMGKGTYGSQRGRPSKAAKSKKMTPAMKMKMMAMKKKKK